MTDIANIQKIIRVYYKSLYVKVWTFWWKKLTQKENENLNGPITINEVESVI